MKKLYIYGGQETLEAELYANSSSEALARLLKKGDITLKTEDYAHMEKCGRLPERLPRNDEEITARPGDIILSEGNLFVLYYAPNTWNFTRLGKVINRSGQALRAILGSGDITLTLHLADHEEGEG